MDEVVHLKLWNKEHPISAPKNVPKNIEVIKNLIKNLLIL